MPKSIVTIVLQQDIFICKFKKNICEVYNVSKNTVVLASLKIFKYLDNPIAVKVLQNKTSSLKHN
jgi:hypothetical protein